MELLGSDAAAGRFRIFKEGWIKTDYGMSRMTPAAGRALIKKFQERGNDMMIDLRHFSISPTATREQSEALGWIPCPNGLEYVDGDGLYAIGAQWTPEVKAGLECKPPKWKYFSPYYDQDKKTKVITELLNVALTNMPATHGLNRLAAERSLGMDLALLGKALAAAMALAESGDEKAVAVRDALIAALGDQADAALDAAQQADAGVEETAAEDDVTAGMGEDEKKAYEALPDNLKEACRAGMKAMQASAAPETQAAESDKKDAVAAESDKKDEGVAAGMLSLDLLQKIAAGEDAQTNGARQKMVTEAQAKGLISKSMAAILLDPSKTSERIAAEFIASRKIVSRTLPGPGTQRLGAPAPQVKRDVESVSAEDRRAAELVAGKTGADVKKVIAAMAGKKK